MNKIYTFLIVLIFMTPGLSHAQEYALTDLYKLAIRNSETIKIAEEDLYISEKTKEKAMSALMPTLSAFGYHTRYSDEKVKDNLILQPEHTNEWGLRLDQTLSISGKEIKVFEITKEEIRKSNYDLETVKEAYLMRVATEYFFVLRTKEALEIATQNVDRLKTHRDAAKTRLEVGTATKTALLRAEAELAGARTELIKAENNLTIAMTRLAKSVRVKGKFTVKEPREGIDYTISEDGKPGMNLLNETCARPVIDCLQEIALSNRAEIKSATIREKTSKDMVKVAEGSYWPDLSIEGVYYRQENEPSSSFGLTERIYGALKLDFPFFEGGLRRAEVSEAKARLRQVEYALEDLKRSIQVEVENAYLFLIRESSVLNQTNAEVKYALDNYNSVSKQFKHGIADSVDVMDANTLLVTAERSLATAKYAYQLSLISLQRSMGTLLQTANLQENH